MPHDGFDRKVLDAASRLAALPHHALFCAKKSLTEVREMTLNDVLRLEGQTCGELLATEGAAQLRRRAIESYRSTAW